MMSDILEQILLDKAKEVGERMQINTLSSLQDKLKKQNTTRGFAAAIRQKIAKGQPAVIAELKKASPSKGIIRQEFDPEKIASTYAANGACCLSVLTDEKYFQGHANHLKAARAVCQLPVLRKDFIIDSYQIVEARVMGADAILLIVAALDDHKMHDLEQTALSLGLDVLVEVHNEQELERALKLLTPLLGINNRNLKTFEISLQTTFSMLPNIPDDKIVISESGIHTFEDIQALSAQNVNAYLIGEAFMKQTNPGAALAAILAP